MTRNHTDLKARLLAAFREEAQEHLQAIKANLLALEGQLSTAEAREAEEAVFRAVHTLKGAARAVGLMKVESICQVLEGILGKIKQAKLRLTRSTLNQFHDAAAVLNALLSGDESPAELEAVLDRLKGIGQMGLTKQSQRPATVVHTEAGKVQPPPRNDTIRVSTEKLDALLLQTEELLLAKLAAGERVGEARALAEAVRQTQNSGSSKLPTEKQTLTGQCLSLLDKLQRDEQSISRYLDALQEEVRQLRMSPASMVFDLFPGMIRNLATAREKAVEFTVQGADLEVDRKVLETIKDPLTHMLRNAVDHGIERPEIRQRAGKPPRGRISLSCHLLEGNRIEVRVEDDGAGIDAVRVREAAVRRRILTAKDAETMSPEQSLHLVFRSGLSTSSMITDVSGHGLGLAIAKDQVERLGGRLYLTSDPGIGTTIRMVLPTEVATFRGLLVRQGGQSFLLPVEAVVRVIRVAPAEVQTLEGRQAIPWDGQLLYATSLGELLELGQGSAPPPEPESGHESVVVQVGTERVIIMVEEILGDREVLVKEFSPPLVRVRNITGAGLLGTGQVVLILRPADLIRSTHASRRTVASPPEQIEEKAMVILVVDDSITTRMMEKNILEAAGYQVMVAVDGVEAWTILKSERCDLVVSDVDMPRMNGFELTSRIRSDPGLADLPVVLVTALESREDKEQGIAVGANAYVVKSSFDQSNLVEIIRRLL